MAGWNFEILDANGEKVTISDYTMIKFSETMNGVGKFTISIPSGSTAKFGKYVAYELSNDSGNEQGLVYFTNPNGFLEFKGRIRRIDYDSAGNILLIGDSTLSFAKRVKLKDVDRSAEANTARISYILGVLDGYYKVTEGTIDSFSGNNLGAVYYKNTNCWKALDNMVVAECQQDYFMKYTSTIGNNDTFEVRNTLGSATSIGTFIDGMHIRGVKLTRDYDSIINQVKVLGVYKSGTPITATSSDATSIAKYGLREPDSPIQNKLIEDSNAAQDYADSIIAQFKDPQISVTFQMLNSNMCAENPDTYPRTTGCFALGDEIVVTSTLANLNEEDLRIESYTRVFYPRKTSELFIKCIDSGKKYKGKYPFNSANDEGADVGGSSTAASHEHSEGDLKVDHAHDVASHLTVSGGGSATSGTFSSGTNTKTLTTSWQHVYTGNFSSAQHTAIVFGTGRIYATGVSHPSTASIYLRMNKGSSYFPTSSGFTINVGAYQGNVFMFLPIDCAGSSVYIDAKVGSGTLDIEYDLQLSGVGLHTHTINTIDDGAVDKNAELTSGDTGLKSAGVGAGTFYAKSSID